jgi:hypothetical protein
LCYIFSHEKQVEKAIETSSARCRIGRGDARLLRLRVKVKDKDKAKHAAVLKAQGKEVNFIWNYTQDLGLKVLGREGRFVSAFEVRHIRRERAKRA